MYVEPHENPPIVWDNQYPAFFASMVKMDQGTMPGPAHLAAWRTYVLYNSLPPERPVSSEPAALVAPSQHDPIAEVWGQVGSLGA